MFEGTVVPAVVYDCKAWALHARIKVLEMKCSKTFTGVTWIDGEKDVETSVTF